MLGVECLVIQSGIRDSKIGFVLIVEEGEQPIIVLLRNRVELVVVALRARDGEAKKRGSGGRQAVHDGFDAELFRVDAAFLIDLGVAVKSGGDFLIEGCVRQKVSGQLVDDELVERQIAVHGLNDPIAVKPDLTGCIHAIPVRIGITGDVKPPARPAFAVTGRTQQSLDHPLIGVRTVVPEKRVHLGNRGRQAGQIKRNAANQCVTVGFWRLFNPFLVKPGDDERVDRVDDFVLQTRNRRNDRAGRSRKGPFLLRALRGRRRRRGHKKARQDEGGEKEARHSW